MNIESILKEHGDLKKKQGGGEPLQQFPRDALQRKENFTYSTSPSISDQFQRWHIQSSMSMDREDDKLSNGGESFEKKSNYGDSFEQKSNYGESPSSSFEERKTTTQSVQQTSVITSVRQKSAERATTDRSRLKSFQRQKSVNDEDMECTSPLAILSNDGPRKVGNSDKNNNTDRQKQPKLHSIAYFLDDNNASNRPKSHIVKSNTQEAKPHSFDRDFYSKVQQMNKFKSKSLDLMDNDIDLNKPQGHSFPIRYLPKHSSFETDEQGSRYINALHISPPTAAPPHLYGHGSLTNSPCGSPIDNSIRHSPAASNGVSQSKRVNLMGEAGSPSMIPMQFGSGRGRPEQAMGGTPFVKSRSTDLQFHRQHKFQQKKAYTLATAPYDVHEKNLRRILSEENVPENLLLKKSLGAHFAGMRRAASYDLISRLTPSSGSSPTRQSSDPNTFASRHKPKATKIMFPEHDNVTDCNSIFTQPIEDERAHALKINKLISDFANNPTYHGPQMHSNLKQPSFDDLEKAQTLAGSVQGGSNTKKNTDSKQSKLLVNQNSMDKNYAIGPYKYDPDIDDHVAVSVSGLLTLPGSNEKKYPISVGELRRRIAPPEFLNKVDMISYVRLAKTSARELLEKHAIRPKHHSRKSKHSVISKMCEAECAELANGIKMLSELYFPKELLAQQAIQRVAEDEEEHLRRQKLTEQRRRYEIAKSVLTEISDLVKTNEHHEEMQDYKLATHSFGSLNLNNNIELLTSILQTQTDAVNQKLCNDGFSDNLSMGCNDSMETESGLGSKNSSIDDPHI
uniref:Transcription factor AP-2 C-terminal domain-containing protein n=2 Tax=Clytia hemisphaerica TaxID=252671 RepID=A0A7M6DQA7_9CNID